MANVPIPQQCTAIALLCDNAAKQLLALAQAYGRNDLQEDIPRLTTTARNAAKLARDSLDVLIGCLSETKSRGARKPTPGKSSKAKRHGVGT